MLIPSKALQSKSQSLQISCSSNGELFGYENFRNLSVKRKKSIVDQIGLGSVAGVQFLAYRNWSNRGWVSDVLN
ncbi:hypothetical protein Pyn_15057 [Prunus yedoensis var. nudiflora]|uniref:Uncharacterized protein n=1 Tax=Prunus yedoensis var. nudiflora TaxID=2094558 RepID=A0A314ZVW6_PRUYE|nr:hypothetical protein Pyn_15057 [Prunus yedoensis var. nudiflora]